MSRRRTLGLLGVVVAAVVFGVWISVCVRYVAQPTIDPVERVDALYVLGPLETRIEPALALMDQGVAPVMVATTSIDARTGEPYFTQYCDVTRNGYRIECVIPEPYTTRGEAELIGREAKARGWQRVAVLASTAQAARARLLLGRCVSDAQVLVWDYAEPRSPLGWLGEFQHQSGGWVQAQLETDC